MFGLLDRATKLTSPTKEKTGGKRELAADEVIEKGFSLPVLALYGHAECIARCPISGAKRKTSALSEYFRF